MKRASLLVMVTLLTLSLIGQGVLAQDTEGPAAPEADARLAVAHLAPFAADPDTAVSIELDGTEVLSDFEFGDSTAYLDLTPGSHTVEVFVPGNATPVLSLTDNFAADTDYTAIAVGGANNWDLELLALVDDTTTPASGKAKVRIGHLAPFADGAANTLADVRLQDDSLVILDDVAFKDINTYIELDAGTYDLKITTPDGSTTLIDPAPVTLNDGDVLSIFAVGDGTNQPLGAFAMFCCAEGFFLPLAEYGYVQIAHLAPFAADPDTAVSIEVDGVEVLSDFEYADSTAYVTLLAGVEHLIEVFPAGSATPAMTETVTLMADGEYTVLATGGANDWDLDLVVLEDDNNAPDAGNAHVRIGHLAPFAAGAANTLADVRLQDGTILLDNVAFGDIADYTPLEAGTYDLKITTADGSTTLIDPMPVTLNDGDIVSVFAVGDGTNQDVGAFALPPDAEGALLPLAGYVQIAHLAPFAADPDTAVSIEVDGVEVLSDVEFADSTGYLPLEADVEHLIEIFPAGSSTPAITGTATLMQGAEYAALATGGANNWDLELVLLEDDNSAPAAGKAHVRIGHLAPFADGAANTRADVRLQDGTVLLDDVEYGDIAIYTPLDAGTYDLKITTADGTTTLIDPIPVVIAEGSVLSLFAVGDGVNQPAAVFALPAGQPGFLLPDRYYVYLPFVMRSP